MHGTCAVHPLGESECLFPENLRSRERTNLVFGAYFGAQRGYKTMGIQCPIVSNNRYQFFGAQHWHKKLLCSKMLVQSSEEIHPGCAHSFLSILGTPGLVVFLM